MLDEQKSFTGLEVRDARLNRLNRQYVPELAGLAPILSTGGGRFYRHSLAEVGSTWSGDTFRDPRMIAIAIGTAGILMTFLGTILGLANSSGAQYAIVDGLTLWIVAFYVLRLAKAKARS